MSHARGGREGASPDLPLTRKDAPDMIVRRVLLVFVFVAASAGMAQAPAAAAAQVTRIAGEDRYATSAAIARSAFPTQVPVAMVAAGRRFPDALTAGPAARKAGGPLLLSQRSAVPDVVVDELTRLRPGRIVMIGGTDAMAESTEAQLAQLTTGSVTRIQGEDRFATSAALSEATFSPDVAIAFVVSGLDFPDAVAAGAGAAGVGGPVLLTRPTALPPETRTELTRLRPRSIVVVGGPNAVAQPVLTELEAFGPVRRVAGADRFATSAALASHLFPSGVERIYLASGETFPDALSGAPVAGFLPAPLILVPTGAGDLPADVRAEVRRLRPTQIVVLGGTTAVSAAMVDQVTAAAEGSEGPPPTTNLVVTALSTPPSSAAQGSTFPVNDEVQNIGSTTAAPSTTAFLLSPDGSTTGAAKLSGTRSVETLAPGSASRGTTTVTVTAAIAPGTYRLLACADDAGAVRETEESDNCLQADGTITVTAPTGGGGGNGAGSDLPNLVETTVATSTPTVDPGGAIAITDEVTNLGGSRAGPSVVAFTLSSDATPSADDISVGERDVSDLAPDTPSSGSTNGVVPVETPPGSYILVGCADATGVVGESIESDNCKIGPQVTVRSTTA